MEGASSRRLLPASPSGPPSAPSEDNHFSGTCNKVSDLFNQGALLPTQQLGQAQDPLSPLRILRTAAGEIPASPAAGLPAEAGAADSGATALLASSKADPLFETWPRPTVRAAHAVDPDEIRIAARARELDLKPKKLEHLRERLDRAIVLSDLRSYRKSKEYRGKTLSMLKEEHPDWKIDKPLPAAWELKPPVKSWESGYLTATAEAKGKRKSMEDAMLTTRLNLKQHVPLFAVFDGHGGKSVSTYLKEQAALHFEEALKGLEQTKGQPLAQMEDEQIEGVLVRASIALNDRVRDDVSSTQTGSTMTMALIIGDHVWCVNVGDSRTLLIDNSGNPIQMSEDAEPQVERFKKSVEKRGGKISGNEIVVNWNGLGIARAFGDFEMTGVSARPKITKQPLGQGLVLCCDGFIEVFTSKQMGEYLAKRLQEDTDLGQAVEQFTKGALWEGTEDNVSALFVDTR